jgi:hypothetical protein
VLELAALEVVCEMLMVLDKERLVAIFATVEEDFGDGVGEVVGWTLELTAFEELGELEDPDPPTGKTTILAVTPLGTVTTQKLAPPAPAA